MKRKLKKIIKRLFSKKVSINLSKNVLIRLLSFILVLSVPVAVIRVCFASKHLSDSSVQKMAGIYGTVTDRFDQTLYDGEVKNEKIFGSVLYGGKMMENVITAKYRKLLTPGKVGYLLGHRTIEEKPRVLKTTLLSEESNRQLVNLFGSKSGCCFSYNYKTGEVYTAISLPSYPSSYINRCFSSVYIPGSTMKAVTSVLAIEQNIDMTKLSYTCTGSLTLPDGTKINCPGPHGKLKFVDSLACSCNCFFATIIMELDLDKAMASLKNLGFSVNEDKAPTGSIDALTKETSRVNITNTASFKNVWSLIGQGSSQVNAVDMAVIAGAVANGGKAATPYIVSSVTNVNKKDRIIYEAKTQMKEYISKSGAEKMQLYWGNAVKQGYHPSGYSELIKYAKTGTAETNSKGSVNKALIGVIEEADTAFYIVIEDWHSGEVLPVTIANTLASLLPKKSN